MCDVLQADRVWRARLGDQGASSASGGHAPRVAVTFLRGTMHARPTSWSMTSNCAPPARRPSAHAAWARGCEVSGARSTRGCSRSRSAVDLPVFTDVLTDGSFWVFAFYVGWIARALRLVGFLIKLPRPGDAPRRCDVLTLRGFLVLAFYAAWIARALPLLDTAISPPRFDGVTRAAHVRCAAGRKRAATARLSSSPGGSGHAASVVVTFLPGTMHARRSMTFDCARQANRESTPGDQGASSASGGHGPSVVVTFLPTTMHARPTSWSMTSDRAPGICA